MKFQDVTRQLYDNHVFGEFGGVNPSITDSSTYTFLTPERMQELFHHEIEGCYLYSRHWTPSNHNLAHSLALMEGTEAALCTASGMAAITCTLLQLCGQGDEVIADRTIYGGTFAFLENMAPRFGIGVRFVDMQDHDAVATAISPNTKVLYTESVSNPLLRVADIPALARLADQHQIKLVVDNTFSPLVLSPARMGAHVVVHSLTKYINGASDCTGGVVCGPKDLIASMTDVHGGAAMLLGPVLDSMRAASLRKNLYTLPIRMKQHSINAMKLAQRLQSLGVTVHYPGLESHPNHQRMAEMYDAEVGFGGMLVLDLGCADAANRLMQRMQELGVGLLAVSLGFYRTLFSAPGNSTSSEIPEDRRDDMGLGNGMVRLSVGIEPHMDELIQRLETCLNDVGVLEPAGV